MVYCWYWEKRCIILILDMVLTLAAALLGCFLFLRWLMACGLRQTAEVSFFAVPSSRRKLYSTHIQKRRGLYRQENCKIFLIALSFRLILLFLCFLITLFLTPEGSEPALLQGLIRGDSVHYVNLVEKGYTGYMENGEHLFLVFFPLYVWLVRAVNVLLGNTLLSGLTMSFLCYSARLCISLPAGSGRTWPLSCPAYRCFFIGIPLFFLFRYRHDRKPFSSYYLRFLFIYPEASMAARRSFWNFGRFNPNARTAFNSGCWC